MKQEEEEEDQEKISGWKEGNRGGHKAKVAGSARGRSSGLKMDRKVKVV